MLFKTGAEKGNPSFGPTIFPGWPEDASHQHQNYSHNMKLLEKKEEERTSSIVVDIDVDIVV